MESMAGCRVFVKLTPTTGHHCLPCWSSPPRPARSIPLGPSIPVQWLETRPAYTDYPGEEGSAQRGPRTKGGAGRAASESGGHLSGKQKAV